MSTPAGPKAKIVLVVAVAENGVIGRDGGLPWRMPSDLKTFRRLTMGKPVVMGRRTFQSLRKPLDGRDNIVVTRDPAFAPEGVIRAGSVEEALALARTCALERGTDEIAVIGGAAVFAAVLPMADRIWLTEVHGRPEGDVLWPPLDPACWEEVSRNQLPRTDADEFAATLVLLQRRDA